MTWREYWPDTTTVTGIVMRHGDETFLTNVTLPLHTSHVVLSSLLSDVEDGEIVTITYLGMRQARAARGKGAWYNAYEIAKVEA